jgi:hypothetical protein
MQFVIQVVVTVLAFMWAGCGIVAANRAGCLGLWRITIWLGPLALLLFRSRD